MRGVRLHHAHVAHVRSQARRSAAAAWLLALCACVEPNHSPRVDAGTSSVEVAPATGIVADGVAAFAVTITLRDASGDPLPRRAVDIAVSGASNAILQPGPTNENGQAFASISSTFAQVETVTATASTSAGSIVLLEQPSIEFIADASTISASLSDATADPFAGLLANGLDASTITVRVVDAHGNPVPDQIVELDVSGSGNTIEQTLAPTDASGTTTGRLQTTTAELKTITVTVNPASDPVVLDARPLVEFVGDPSDISALLSSAVADPELGVVADGVVTSTITVVVRDAYGNPVAGQDIEIAASGGSNSLSQPGGPTDASGVATATLASTLAELKTISVTVNPGADPVVLVDRPTIEFVGDPSTISASLSSAAASPDMDVVADGVVSSTITVVVRDAYGNPVAGQVVEVAASGGSNLLSQPGGPTDGSGAASASLASTLAELKTISVTINPGAGAVSLLDEPDVEFIADASTISAGLSSAVASPDTGVVADGVEVSAITVVVRDAYGNPVPGQLVDVAASGSSNVLSQPGEPSDGSGVATATLASTLAELKTISVTVNPGAAAVSLLDQPTIEFVGDPSTISASLSSAEASPDTDVVADGLELSTITVVVRDANGNPVAGQVVEVAASGGSNSLSQPGGPTDSIGVASATLASTLAELKTISVTVNPGAAAVSLLDQPTIEFVGDPSTISASLSSAEASPDTDVVADGLELSTITVVVRDANGNPVAGQVVEVAASGGSNSLSQPGGPTDSSGVASATLASTLAELKTISVTVNPGGAAVSLLDQPTIEFVGDPATISSSLSSVAASPDAGLVADGVETSTITVIVRDANGNPVAGQVVEVAASGTGNVIVQPPSATDASGVAIATLASTVAEAKVVTAMVDPGPSAVVLSDQPSVVFDGGLPVSSSLSTIDATPAYGSRANGSDSVTIQVVVRNDAGTPLAGHVVELSATGSGNALLQPGSPTDASGVATGTLLTTAAETKTISATIDPGPSPVALDDTPAVVFVWSRPKGRFVRSTGSDANTGESPAQAWLTIGKAASSISAGDTVYVGAGTYPEAVLVTTDGTASEPIVFLADSAGEHTGDAGEVVIDSMGATSTFHIDGADYVTLHGFTITGATTGTGAGVRVGDGATLRVKILRNRIYGNGRGILAKNAQELIVEGNRISKQLRSSGFLVTGGEGALLDDCADAEIRNNLVYANEGYGIAVTGGAQDVTVEANSFYANEDDQILVDALLNLVTVRDDIVSVGLADGIELSLGSLLTSSYNISWGNIGLEWLGLLPGTGDLSADPNFVDPPGADAILGGAGGDDDRFELDDSVPSPGFDTGSTSAGSIALSDGSTLADLSSRLDGVLDGTAPDGATVNMGFHELAPLGALDSLAGSDARLAYGESDERQPRARRFDHGTDAWSAEAKAPPVGANLRWLVHGLTPLANSEELALAFSDDGSSTHLELLRWGGAAWSEDWSASGIASADSARRGFDLAYEASGDAVAVYSDGTANPRFRVRTQGAWTAESALFTSAPGSGAVLWMELDPRPASDEISLVFADANACLFAVVWSGSAWDTPNVATLESTLRTVSTKSFDLAHEESSGDALVLWAGPSNAPGWATRAAGASAWSVQSGIPGLGFTPSVFDLAAEPGSDRIAMIGLEDVAAGSEPKAAMWDGSAWTDVQRLETGSGVSLAAQAGDVNVAAGWVGTGGVAIAIYADETSGAIDWGRWTAAGGWSLQTDVSVAGKTTTASVRVETIPGEGRLVAVLSDSDADLFAALYDGTSWSITNGGASLETTLSSTSGVAFDLRFAEP